MNVKQLLDRAREEDEAAAAEKRRRMEKYRAAQAGLLKLKTTEFIEWLGDLAKDIDVTPKGVFEASGKEVVKLEWSLKEWRIPFPLEAQYWQNRWGVKGAEGSNIYQDIYPGKERAADSEEFIRFLLYQQQAYERKVDERVGDLIPRLKPGSPRRTLTEDAADEVLGKLHQLAPERAAEWEALYSAWEAERREEQAKEAAAAVQMNDALNRYRTAWVEYCREEARVAATNKATLAALQERVNKPRVVRKLEYGLLDYDEEDGICGNIRSVWVAYQDDDPVSDHFKVYENGRCTGWTFWNVVRLSASRAFYPVDDDIERHHLFRRERTIWGDVWYAEEDAAEVQLEIGKLPPYPAEPDWAAISGGLPWTQAVWDASVEAATQVERE